MDNQFQSALLAGPGSIEPARRACEPRPQIELTLDTKRLLYRYAEAASLSPINSGNARRKPPLRGLSTFVPYGRWLESGWVGRDSADNSESGHVYYSAVRPLRRRREGPSRAVRAGGTARMPMINPSGHCRVPASRTSTQSVPRAGSRPIARTVEGEIGHQGRRRTMRYRMSITSGCTQRFL
jgi:hypothetical protein